MRIGLLSDTHSYLDPAVFQYFSACDEIWHAGDFGSTEVADQLKSFKPLRGVYGNIDSHTLRLMFPLFLAFEIHQLKVLMIHIGGRPGKYPPQAQQLINTHKPALFICGHSHILTIKKDDAHNMIYLNPGAAGKSGFHKIKTLVRFTIHNAIIKDVEVIELGKR